MQRFSMAVALLCTGCLEVEVTAPSVCLNAQKVDLSVGPLPAWLEGPMTVEEEVAPDAVELPEGLSGELVVQEGLLTTDASLEFVRAARVHVMKDDVPVDLLVYDRDVDGVASDSLPIRVASDEPVDVLSQVADGSLALGVELEGDAEAFPPELFVDARVCMAGQVRYVQRWVDIQGF